MARNLRATAPNADVQREVMVASRPPEYHLGIAALPGYDASMMDAPNQMINVALKPTDPHCGCTPGNCSCGPECGCMCCWGNSPGGRENIIQYNEKGVLEAGLHHVISMSTQAPLSGMHDNYAQGIYRHPETPYGLDD